MILRGKSVLALGFGPLLFAAAMLAYVPVAEAQFFFPRWLDDRPRQRPKPRVVKPRPPPIDELPPIVPKESSIPPPPDDRPYDNKLLRLAEILGSIHYLRELCGAQEGQLWREQMRDILKHEGTTAVRRAKLVSSFNDGYRGYRRTYRSCTPSATLATTRFRTEGARIAAALAQSSEYASQAKVTAPVEGASPDAALEGDLGIKPKENASEANSAKPAAQAEQAPAPAPPVQGKKRRKKAPVPVEPPD
ncbi:MAG: TIGR02301 family protein [Methyloceanibacter sp.]|uniref:TIGR02301 family protein n=1 Tax=Methyloceanibacter sp. TaxID=1965321 RepID=UPI003D9B142F